MMNIDKLIEDLRGLLKQYGEKIPYGELVGAPWPYSRAGDLVWQDPEPYFIEQAATALSTLQAENAEMQKQLNEFSEFLCRMTGGRLSKTNYTAQEMISAANDYQQKVCEECDLQAENEKLRSELEHVRESNKKLCATLMKVQKSERPERVSVVYELDYDAALSHQDVYGIAGIVFEGLMREDKSQRGQKED